MPSRSRATTAAIYLGDALFDEDATITRKMERSEAVGGYARRARCGSGATLTLRKLPRSIDQGTNRNSLRRPDHRCSDTHPSPGARYLNLCTLHLDQRLDPADALERLDPPRELPQLRDGRGHHLRAHVVGPSTLETYETSSQAEAARRPPRAPTDPDVEDRDQRVAEVEPVDDARIRGTPLSSSRRTRVRTVPSETSRSRAITRKAGGRRPAALRGSRGRAYRPSPGDPPSGDGTTGLTRRALTPSVSAHRALHRNRDRRRRPGGQAPRDRRGRREPRSHRRA